MVSCGHLLPQMSHLSLTTYILGYTTYPTIQSEYQYYAFALHS
jgi:hypothetical protein